MSGIVALIIQRRIRNQEKEKVRMQTMIRNKRFRDLSNPYEDPGFQSTYRLTPDLALAVLRDLKPVWRQHRYSSSLPVELKFLCALHFFAHGSYQKSLTKDVDFKVSQPTSSRAISEAVAALNRAEIISKWINFPNRHQIEAAVLRNYEKFGIPGVLGYVDGTYIKFKKPTQHEELYVNRKGEHTLNVQMVCDNSLKIFNVCARYPGATHDSFIWRFSALRRVMINLNSEGSTCWLLGDSGYPLEPWLLTPILNAVENTPQSRYTNAHIKSRNCIERCFGVLKSRFRCLLKKMDYEPTKVGCIVNACAVLHNVCITAGLILPDIVNEDALAPDASAANEYRDAQIYERGLQVRQQLIQRLFYY